MVQTMLSIRMMVSYLFEHHPELFKNGTLRLLTEWGDGWILSSEGYLISGPQHAPTILDVIEKLYERVWTEKPKAAAD